MGGGGGGGGYCHYCPSETTLFMRTCWFIVYNILLEFLLPAMQELLCFPQICKWPADRHILILSLYRKNYRIVQDYIGLPYLARGKPYPYFSVSLESFCMTH